MTLAGASGAVLAAGVSNPKKARAIGGDVTFANGGRDFSPVTGKERQAIPTACWQCGAMASSAMPVRAHWR